MIDRNTGEPKPCNISLFKLNPDSTYRFQEDDETAKGLGKIVFSDTIPPHNTYFLKVEPGELKSWLKEGIRITHVLPDDNFEIYRMPINIPDGVTGSYELPTIELEPINARHLDEVEVFATKLKFYHKGDTLVYNAAAFMLSNGSMLEELVSQLPGVELKEGGQILSDGRMVESLLINGKDLFNGKTDIALQNLAAYTVDNIKVYNKAGHLSQMIGADAGDMKLVMDVKLKREFSHGWIGNLQGGYGSDNRYMAIVVP